MIHVGVNSNKKLLFNFYFILFYFKYFLVTIHANVSHYSFTTHLSLSLNPLKLREKINK